MGIRQTVLLEIFPVLADVLPPLRRHCKLIENGVHGTYRLTVRAVDAGFRVYVKHIVCISGDDTVHRANFYTTRVFYPYTGLGDYIRHTGNI